MLSVRVFLLLTLLYTICAAVPTPTRTRLVPRSFKVEKAIKSVRARRDPIAAISKAYRKYNMGYIGPKLAARRHGRGRGKGDDATPTEANNSAATTTAATNGTADDGEVQADPEENDALFLSPVKIGGQTLNLDFDTGSSDLWVFSSQLDNAYTQGHSVYDPTKSSTFQMLDGESFEISYGDGSGAAGNVGTDVVDIGGATVTSQAIEMATAISASFAEDTNLDGLVGLAFSKINTVTPTQQKTFFDNIMPDLDQPVFTADLTNDTSGTYEFGTIDPTKFQGNISYVDVDSSQGFWQFQSTSFAIGGKVQQNTNASPAIADTGTSLLLVDDAVATAYYAAVDGAQNSAEVGGFVYPCDATLPDFAVAIGDSYMATVPGDQITFTAVDEAGTTCYGGVQSNSGSDIQIYGDTLFKTQFVVFDGGNVRLGMAPKA